MIYQLIKSWLNIKIEALNSALLNEAPVREVDANLDVNFLPANLKDRTYLIKLTEIENVDEFEDAGIFKRVKVLAEFQFMLAKQPVEYYKQIIDSYMYGLSRIILNNDIAGLNYQDPMIDEYLTLYDLKNLKITGLNTLNKMGNYLMPKVEFNIGVIDESRFLNPE
ncbi:MAG: hypothetical protein EHM58_03130 [Ignavibacteriae bacterium]|nr:MAG: hypothetical protein EHM58_03130 [Ignavibacteriota bacterium]